MNPPDSQKETVTIKNLCRAKEDEHHHLESAEVKARHPHTIKYIEKKLIDRGVYRPERKPADGLPLKHDAKKGRGGKYTWEGPVDDAQFEVEDGPIAIDDKDPNYVEEDDELNELVVGEVEVPKVAEGGVARVEVDPHLKFN